MDKFTELRERVERWADVKGILANSSPIKQAEKTLEEANELIYACMGQEKFVGDADASQFNEQVADAIGDVLVTIIIQAKMQDMDILKCLEDAVSIIEKRTGRMENGMFVKD